MVLRTNKTAALTCAALTVGVMAEIAPPAHAGFLGKITKAVIYPIRKVGNNTSVDAHRVLQKNSVEKSNSPNSPNEVVKPDGHRVPMSGN